MEETNVEEFDGIEEATRDCIRSLMGVAVTNLVLSLLIIIAIGVVTYPLANKQQPQDTAAQKFQLDAQKMQLEAQARYIQLQREVLKACVDKGHIPFVAGNNVDCR